MFYIECDIDGVILDIHERGLNPHLKEIYPPFEGDTHICSWSMKELDRLHPELRPTALKLFSNPEFICSLQPYNDSLLAFSTLCNFVETNRKGGIIVNTNVSAPCVEARKMWINGVLRRLGNFEAKVTSSSHKVMSSSLICIEDNVDNLRASNATYKFLIRRGHNRLATSKDLGASLGSYVVPSLMVATNLIITSNI